MPRPATAYRHSFAADEDARVTLVTQLGSPCRFIGGCQSVAVGNTGRCRAHQPPRLVRAETAEQSRLRLVAIATTHVQRETSVPVGAWR